MNKLKPNVGRKTRNSIEGQRSLVTSRPITPPPEVICMPGAEAVFYTICQNRNDADWAPYDIEIVALLARMHVRILEQESILATEDAVVMGSRGELRENPRISAICKMAATAAEWRRSLGLHAVDARYVNRRPSKMQTGKKDSPIDSRTIGQDEGIVG